MVVALFVGLDAHKSSIVATVVDREGRRVDQTRLSSADSELIGYLERLPASTQGVLEACNVWQHVYDAAASTGARVTLAHPYQGVWVRSGRFRRKHSFARSGRKHCCNHAGAR